MPSTPAITPPAPCIGPGVICMIGAVTVVFDVAYCGAIFMSPVTGAALETKKPMRVPVRAALCAIVITSLGEVTMTLEVAAAPLSESV